MKWSVKTWKSAKPILDKILSHPFIDGLINGTLDRQKFIFYIEQDAVYLSEYGKILAGIAAKIDHPEYSKDFLYFAADSITVENALHKSFLKKKDIKTIQPSPGCLLYTSYLHKHLSNSSVEVATAAILPCFWIYQVVGDYILSNQQEGNNPYQSWIDTYGGKEFAASVKKAIGICDDLAENASLSGREAMAEAFIICSKMEWMFWDSAWKLEKWEI